mgnify:CR=1 FL=1
MASSQDEFIIITGVTQGLGLAMTDWFEMNNYTIIGCGITSSKISDLNKKYCPQGRKQRFFVVDIANKTEVNNWAKEVIEQFGSPRMIINNASVINFKADLVDIPVDEFENIIDVNIKGTVNVIRAFVPTMIKSQRGVIVNMSSGYGRTVAPQVAPYCCTKWAIEGLSKALANELPAPLVCVPLNPGCINTEMLQKTVGKIRAACFRSPDKWAQTACPYILSINRSKHNGQSITAP